MIIKCKMCGGDLELKDGMTVCECEYCGSRQTIPIIDNEKKAALYERANRLRYNCEFDKASTVYESIISEFHEEAEAYWGLILCKYGIEYVDDPATGKKIPTCHRSSFDSLMDDPDFEMVMENADAISRRVYREQAKEIEEVRKGIIEVSGKEEPYDIFICYKETDENGERTIDSVLAQDVYDALTAKGYRVFFSRISLEDKLGTEYEPYIFAALNSAKVMLAFGTSYDFYNAVWVKNEWGRFLKLMASDKSKHLIPCYKDLDAYDIPKEFRSLQAQDLGKVGAVQDLIRGISKILSPSDSNKNSSVNSSELREVIASAMSANTGNNADALLKRGYMALEDEEWEQADSFFENVLNKNAECAEAYFGKFLAKEEESSIENWIQTEKEEYSEFETECLEACSEETDHINQMASKMALEGYLTEDTIKELYQYDRGYDSKLSCRKDQKNEQLDYFETDRLLMRSKQYGSGSFKKRLEDAIDEITAVLDRRISEAQKEDHENIERVKNEYSELIKQADKRAEELNQDAQDRREQRYQFAVNLMEQAGDIPAYCKANIALLAMNGYKDSKELATKCQLEIARIKEEQRREEERLATIRKAAVERAEKERREQCYQYAVSLMNNASDIPAYEKARDALKAMDGYKDSGDLAVKCQKEIDRLNEEKRQEEERQEAIRKMKAERIAKKNKMITAIATATVVVFVAVFFLMTMVIIPNINYNAAVTLMDSGDYEAAITAFDAMDGYKDSESISNYLAAVALMESGDYEAAITAFEAMDGYRDSAELIENCEAGVLDKQYDAAVASMNSGDYEAAITAFNAMNGYKDSAEFLVSCESGYLNVSDVGDSIYFGTYEQDDNTSNGNEDIEWIVLAKEDTRVLVISKYVLDFQKYKSSRSNVTWESCSLREWMNRTFLNEAFSAEEEAMIATTTVTADKNPKFSTSAGNDTQDQVFLLSVTEVKKYFSSDRARRCETTKYANISNSGENCYWWLRSPGRLDYDVATVTSDGAVSYIGYNADGDGCGVRPAMWINLES